MKTRDCFYIKENSRSMKTRDCFYNKENVRSMKTRDCFYKRNCIDTTTQHGQKFPTPSGARAPSDKFLTPGEARWVTATGKVFRQLQEICRQHI